MKEVLSKVGFSKFNFDATSDKMWWRPSNQMQKIENFVYTIGKHGFKDKESVMSSAVLADGTFNYKNVTQLIKQTGSRRVTEIDRVERDNGDIPLLAWKVISLGGAVNMMSGYGSVIKQEKLDGSSFGITDMIMPLLGGSLNMSSLLKNTIGDVVKQYVPTDLTNTHSMYYQAREQNTRGLQQMQSTKIEFTTNQSTGLKIHDVIDFRPHNVITQEPLEMISGSFIITNKTKFAQGAKVYREKFIATSNSFSPGSGQVGWKK